MVLYSVSQPKLFAILFVFVVFAIQSYSQAPTPTPEIREEVIIEANRAGKRLDENPASIVVLSRPEITTNASPVVDDILRQTVGFNLFRRSSSRTANPTTQGASFRGIGSSGASRSLVLLENVPINDAFGGWIVWNRVPAIALEKIEVIRGGASSLYGSNALSGSINLIPRKTKEEFEFSAEIFGGTQKTFSASTFFGFKRKNWTFDFVAAAYQTKGYIPIDQKQRGVIDSFSGSKNSNFTVRIERKFRESANIFIKPSYFGEVRSNGTGLQTNRTHLKQLVFGGESNLSKHRLNWQIYGGDQVYDQVFSAIAIDRRSESLTRIQRVPSQNFGFSTQFSTAFKNQTILLGFEGEEIRGTSNELLFSQNSATSFVGSGGRERTYSIYFQDFAKIGKFVVVGNLRFDSWQNLLALSAAKTLSNNQTSTTIFPNRIQQAWSPQISTLYQISPKISLFASVSGSFRSPTLNELYRAFRVGNVLTLANDTLEAEKATNFEAGLSYSRQSFYLRSNIFLTEIFKPISNVTLSQSPNLITRQRLNVGQNRSQGFEIEIETLWRNFNFSSGYLLADSKVIKFPANRTLENLRVPQIARHQLTFQTRYAQKDWSFALQVRASSKQYDDDLNTFELEPYFQMDAFAAKNFKENLQVFVGIENVLNSRFSIAKTPIRSVSSPINLRIGIRWR